MGSYTYGNTNKPYAVTSAGGVNYAYDANGRMTSRGGAAITWYSYDLPQRINHGTGSGAVSSEFFYGTGRARYKQLRRSGSSVISTIYYVGSLYERETAGGTTTHRHHIFAGGEAIGQMTRTQAGANSFEYFHRDHQGSVTKVTNGSGSVIQSLSFDAFGKRRNADWSADTAGNRFNDTHFTKQGYTGHEHLDNVRLIHMNGRVQDPTLGRFISPDPFVPDPRRSQAFDRFGYVYNNPLAHTDSSGYFPEPLRRHFDSFEFFDRFDGFDPGRTDEIVVTRRRPGPYQGFADLPLGFERFVDMTSGIEVITRPPNDDEVSTRPVSASRDGLVVRPATHRALPNRRASLNRRAGHLRGSGLDLGDPAAFRHAMLTPGAAILRDEQLLRYIDDSARGARRAISIVGAGALGSRALKESLRAMPPAARPHLLRFLELIMPAAENDPNRFPSPREADPLEWGCQIEENRYWGLPVSRTPKQTKRVPVQYLWDERDITKQLVLLRTTVPKLVALLIVSSVLWWIFDQADYQFEDSRLYSIVNIVFFWTILVSLMIQLLWIALAVHARFLRKRDRRTGRYREYWDRTS